jgi:hypothetical protein
MTSIACEYLKRKINSEIPRVRLTDCYREHGFYTALAFDVVLSDTKNLDMLARILARRCKQGGYTVGDFDVYINRFGPWAMSDAHPFTTVGIKKRRGLMR